MASKKTSPQNEETFRLLFAHHPIPMWIYDLKTLAFLEVNDAAQEKYSYTREEFLTMTIKDIRPAEDVDRLIKNVEQKRPGIQQAAEWRHRLKNGEIIDVEITSHTLEFEGRKAALVMAQDITERKRAEDALKASTEFSNNLIASMQDGVSVLDKEGVHLDVNPALCRMTGFSREELIGSGIPHPYWPPEEYEQIQAALQQTLVNESASFELTFKRKNGERFPVIVSPFAIKDDGGNVVSYSATVKDITERRKTEEALRESEEKWHSLVSASPDYIALFDREGRYLFLNHYAENFTEEQVIGTSLFDYLSPESKELYRTKMEECLSTLTSQKFEFNAMGDYGINRAYEQYLVPIINAKQETELLAIARDITERKQVEDALRESEQNLNILFETMSEGIALNEIIYDENGEMVDYRILSVNQAFYSIADYRGKNVVGAFATKLYGMSPEFIKEFWRGHKEKKFTAYTEMVSPLGNRLFFVATSPFVNDKFVTSFFDITERKKVEEALRVSEEKFRSLLDSQESNILVLDFDGVHHYVNQAGVASITDSGTTGNIIGKRLHDLYPANIADWQLEQIRRVITTGQGMTGDFQNQSSWWHLNLQPIRNASGQVVQVMVNSRDITERKQAEEKNQKIARHYQALIEKAPDGIILLNEQGDFKFASPSAKKMFGYHDADEVTGNPAEHTHPEDLSLVLSELSRLLADPSYVPTLQYRYAAKNLNWRWVESTFSNLLADPNVESIVINFRDITERKLAENKLLESEARYSMLMDQASDGIFLSNGAGHYIDVNQAGCAMLGFTRNEILSMSMKDLVPAEDLAAAPFRLDELRQGKTVIAERRLKHKNGVPVPVEISAKILSDGTMQGIVRNIIERKLAEEKIQQLNAELEQRVEERTQELRETQEKLVRHEKLAVLGQMASSIGHELRNPLSVIASAIYYLKLVQPHADEKIREYLGIIDQEVRTSEKIITDLLDFARVKSVDREAVSVSELIRQTLERFPAPASVDVTLEIPTDLPQVYVDIHQITQVLGNLTVNACQAMTSVNAQNGRQLSLYSRIQNDMIIITVKDNGTGMTPENMKKLFEPLFTTKAKGIGLGLAVSQKLIGANGGRIEVESEPGKGSSFHVFLPIYKEAK